MHLPSFYKLQLEKYLFNLKRVGVFMIPVVCWGNYFVIIQSDGLFILNSTIQFTLILFHPPEESKEESKQNNDYQ